MVKPPATRFAQRHQEILRGRADISKAISSGQNLRTASRRLNVPDHRLLVGAVMRDPELSKSLGQKLLQEAQRRRESGQATSPRAMNGTMGLSPNSIRDAVSAAGGSLPLPGEPTLNEKGRSRYLQREDEIVGALRAGKNLDQIAVQVFGKRNRRFLTGVVLQSPAARQALKERIEAMVRERHTKGWSTTPNTVYQSIGIAPLKAEAFVREENVNLLHAGKKGFGPRQRAFLQQEAAITKALRSRQRINMIGERFGGKSGRVFSQVIREHPPFSAALKERIETVVAANTARGRDTSVLQIADKIGMQHAQVGRFVTDMRINISPLNVRQCHLDYVRHHFGDPRTGKKSAEAIARARGLDPETVRRMATELGLGYKIVGTPPKRPEIQRRVFDVLLGAPAISNEALGKRVPEMGSTSLARRKNIKLTKREILRGINREILQRQEWSPESMAAIRPLESGPPLGEELGKRLYRLHRLGEERHLFNPQIKTPPSIEELDAAMGLYVTEMRRGGHEVKGKRAYNELSTDDIFGARDNYVRTALGIKLYDNLEKLPEVHRRVLHLFNRDPAAACKLIGITDGRKAKIIAEKAKRLRVISEYAYAIKRIKKCSTNEARKTLLAFLPATGYEPVEYHTDWSRLGERKYAALAAVKAAGGNPIMVTAAQMPSGLYNWMKRERGTRNWTHGVSEWLLEAKEVTPEQARLLRMRKYRPLVFKTLMQRADPGLTQASHTEITGLKPAAVSDWFGKLETGLQKDLQMVAEGKQKLTDVAHKYDVGVRGIARLHDTYTQEGAIRLWSRGRKGTDRNPPLKEDMRTFSELVGELEGEALPLSGLGAGRLRLRRGAIVRRPDNLEKVHVELQDLLRTRRGSGGAPSSEVLTKIQSLRKHLDDVGQAADERTVEITGGKGMAAERRIVDITRMMGIVNELEEETQAYLKHAGQ